MKINSAQSSESEQNAETSENRPRQSLKLSWSDVNYSLRLKRTRREMKDLDTNERYYDKHIISNTSGVLCDGEALFIMGPSGAGKSTLLNILSGRVSKPRNCKLEGNVTINHEVTVTKSNFGNYAAYVMQDDSLYPSFTCEQAIIFAARLKLNLSYKQAKEVSDKIISSLSLDHCRKTLIGDTKIKGLSGGEKRRTSIAVELVSDPPILFLDEPTSGLDSFTSTKIVKLISDLAKNGKMIIATIHQPNSESFAMFDKLLLLVDGNTVYQGRAEDSVDYFNRIGYEVPEFCNPSDFFIKEFTIPYYKSEKDEIKIRNLIESYQEILHIDFNSRSESLEDSDSNKSLKKFKVNHKGSCIMKELWILCLRSLYNIFFHPFFLKLKIFLSLMNIFLILSFFYDLKNDTEGIRNKECCLYFYAIIASVGPTTGIVMLIGSERPIFIREYSSKTYRLLPYVLSKLFVESPFEVIRTILHCVIPYYALGLRPSFYNFSIFIISQILNTIVFSSFGLALGNVFSNPNVAVSFAPLILLPSILFSGILCNLGTIYSWLSWMQYLSPLRYTMEILIRNEFEGVSLDEENPIDALHYNLGSTLCFTILCCLTLIYILLCIVFLKLNVRHM